MDSDSSSRDRKGGILYVVATPIGNLEDITLRALRILKEVDLIVAENGNHTRRLCVHYGIKQKLPLITSIHVKARRNGWLNNWKPG